MKKTEVIVDTCFLQKLSSEGKKPENIKTILSEFDFVPIAHPYIIEHELSMKSYSEKMVKDGYIKKIEYVEFLKDDYDRHLYESYFFQLHEDLRLYLKAKEGPKQIKKLALHSNQNIYDTHIQGSSMGDVHMILMAAFMHLPIILTEDSDIDLLRSLAKKRTNLGQYTLEIYDAWDLIKQIAEKQETDISKKELEQILNEMGERPRRSEMKTIWNNHHM